MIISPREMVTTPAAARVRKFLLKRHYHKIPTYMASALAPAERRVKKCLNTSFVDGILSSRRTHIFMLIATFPDFNLGFNLSVLLGKHSRLFIEIKICTYNMH